MAHQLVIVESPAKARTIEKYLGGKEFSVLASYGHVRDLIPKTGAVDVAHDFEMKYEPIEKNAKHMAEIIKALKKADTLYLAPDPDREGEAIAWHIEQLLKEKGLLKKKKIQRIVFHEITKKAIQEAVAHPRDISMDLVNAQQARRALDYLVGFNLSPLIWKKVQYGLSAGRVQSPALRMIVEREEEIEKFIAQEYWTIETNLSTDAQTFTAKLSIYAGEKVEQFTITSEDQAKKIEKDLLKRAKGKLTVADISKKERKRHPSPPFITSTLQQEAVRKLGFSAQKAMQIAQQLYEGIDIGGEHIGLITYMRTDSVSLAQEAIQEIRNTIVDRYGKKNLPSDPVFYKTKSKNAQEAHEAVRPTSVQRIPEQIKKHLSSDQFKLYDLIWKRTMACQMISATINLVAVDLAVDDKNTFRANGSTIADPGFILAYQEGRDDLAEDDERMLPELKVGQEIPLEKILPLQHFTEPPPRYNEATLVKALEEHDIGRPSTYATIISTLKNRKYVEVENKRFKPTDVGRVVSHFLTQYFTQYVDYEFTAKLEDELDEIARGEKAWVPTLKNFWKPFKKLVDHIGKTVKKSDVTEEKIDEACPQCGKPLAIKLGRGGKFISCTGYPECKYARNLNEAAGEESTPEIVPDRKCPKCESDLIIRMGRFGKFIGCSKYPKCKFIESLNQPNDSGVVCPECKQGSMVERRSRWGKSFYSCNRYPDCKYAVWNLPVAEECPKCHWPVLTIKETKRWGKQKVCPQKECGYTVQLE